MKRFLKQTFMGVCIVISMLINTIAFAVPQGSADALFLPNLSVKTDVEFSAENQTKNISVGVEYSDEFFGQGSTVYNHGLAKVSAAVSAAAYEAPVNAGNSADDWRADNIKNAAKELGFGNISTYNYDNGYFAKMREKGVSDSCGFAFAEKDVAFDPQNPLNVSKIVLVAIRGTAVEEWFGNFNIIDPLGSNYDVDEHYSFRSAEKEIRDALEKYLGKNKGDANLKIWITGHSRGAAVANLLSADITDGGFASKENIYTYTFATPNGTKNAHDDLVLRKTRYDNVWNIVNPDDFVPYLAFGFDGWEFGKWGNTLYLPNRATAENKTEFDAMLGVVSENFRTMTGESYRTYDNGYVDTYGFILDAYSVGSTVEKAYKTVNGQSVSLVEYFNMIAKLLAWNDAGIAVRVGFDVLVRDTNEVTEKFARMGLFLAENGLNKKMTHSHEPATYIAWMNAIEADDLSGDFPVFGSDDFAEDNKTDEQISSGDVSVTSFGSVASPWAVGEMEKAYENELVPDEFHGSDLTVPVRRDEFAAIAVTYFEKVSGKSVEIKENPFSDIEGSVHKTAVMKAYTLGITNGIREDAFEPNSLITREQAAVMLMRTAGLLGFDTNSSQAVEESVSSWAKDGVGFVNERKIMNGTGFGFEPFGTYTREQAFATFVRMFENLK